MLKLTDKVCVCVLDSCLGGIDVNQCCSLNVNSTQFAAPPYMVHRKIWVSFLSRCEIST